jgi:cysteine desulfurase / selenocysteine lyase
MMAHQPQPKAQTAGVAKEASSRSRPLDIERVRRDFPILNEPVRGKPLVYLDNAATSQKPLAVIEAVSGYYEHANANVHRGVHLLSERATENYEGSREKVRRFLNAKTVQEIVFVRGTTEGINLVAQSFGRKNIQAGDEIVVTELEHHSNIVPWQMLCEERGATLKVARVEDNGELNLAHLESLLTEKTRLLGVAHVSNALGTVLPVKRIVEMAHARGIKVLVDGAQGVPHQRVDVQALDCDFYVFSGHKLYAPTGIGVLYGKEALLDAMPPFMGGGDMILSVTFQKTTFNRLPYKFEAGTPNIGGAIGLGAAIDYVEGVGLEAIEAYENGLLAKGTQILESIPGLRLVGTAPKKAGVLSFMLDDIHPHDVGTILDREGIAIRTGHHCAQPLMQRLGLPATARASLALYNTPAELEVLAKGLKKVQEVFR